MANSIKTKKEGSLPRQGSGPGEGTRRGSLRQKAQIKRSWDSYSLSFWGITFGDCHKRPVRSMRYLGSSLVCANFKTHFLPSAKD